MIARSHLILFELVLGRTLSLAFPPELLQVCFGAVQGVLLQLVLGLIALEGGLRTMDRQVAGEEHFMQTFLGCTQVKIINAGSEFSESYLSNLRCAIYLDAGER